MKAFNFFENWSVIGFRGGHYLSSAIGDKIQRLPDNNLTFFPCLEQNHYESYFVCEETYDFEELTPLPEEECPECLIPEGTKCNGNKFSRKATEYETLYGRIINGVEARPHSWPWIARIETSSPHSWAPPICAGAIINRVRSFKPK